MDTHYLGDDVKLLSTNSFKECQDECSKEKQCEAFTWSGITDNRTMKNECHLKNDISKSHWEYKGLISGPKYCGNV